MNRQEKAQVIESVKSGFEQSKAAFLVGYQGLTVKQLQSLRRELRAQGGSLQVVKARLMKRAASEVPSGKVLEPYFREQIGLVFASNESPAVAKVLHEFAKKNELLKLVAGSLGEQLLDSQAIVRIANLPSREVLLAQLCGTLQAPMTGLVSALNQVPLRLLWALNQYAQQKQQ